MRHELDLVGEVCPVPVLKAAEAMERLAPGDVLTIITDFARSVRNLMDWAERCGHPFEVEELADGSWAVHVSKV